MPPLDSTIGDTNTIGLLSEWVTNRLPDYQNFADWQIARFGSVSAPDAAPDADPDGDGVKNSVEYLTGTDPLAGGDAWEIRVRQYGNAVEISFPQIANRGFQVEWASSLASPISWQPLDVPGNRPFFPSSNTIATVTDIITDTPFRSYRVRVFEP